MHRRDLVAALLLGSVAVAGCGGGTGADKGFRADPATVAHRIAVGADPIGIAASRSGDVWVASAGDEQAVLLEAGSGRPDARVPVPGTPLRLTLAEDGAAVWVTAFGPGEVVRVDTATRQVTDRVHVGEGAEGVTEAFGSLWVAAQDAGLLVQVDLATRKVVHEVDVGRGVRLVVPDPDALWLDDQPGGTVVRVDPQTYRVRRSDHVCDGPEDLAVTRSTVWVTCSTGDEVVALGADDLRPTRRIALPGTPDAIAAAPDGSLLVVLQEGPTLVRLDGSTGAVAGRARLGRQPQLHDKANLDVAVTGEDAWVTSYADNSVFRIPWRV